MTLLGPHRWYSRERGLSRAMTASLMVDQPTTPGKKTGWSWPRKVGVAIGCLALLIIAFVALLHTRPARRIILAQVTRLLKEENVSFNTDELRYNLFDLTL